MINDDNNGSEAGQVTLYLTWDNVKTIDCSLITSSWDFSQQKLTPAD